MIQPLRLNFGENVGVFPRISEIFEQILTNICRISEIWAKYDANWP